MTDVEFCISMSRKTRPLLGRHSRWWKRFPTTPCLATWCAIVYGYDFTTRVDGMGIRQVPISARSPWQNCYAERMIGSIRRECLNHVIVINEWHLRRILKSYFSYYHYSRTHLSLDKDAPESRPVQDLQAGRIIQIREVGGLHHRYERRAA